MVWNYTIPSNTFSDPDGDTLTVSAKMKNGDPLPSWLTFNPAVSPYGKFTGTPEASGVLSGAYELRVTATDGVEAVNADFVLYIGDASGLPVFAPLYDVQPKVTIYDCIAPPGAGTASVMIGLDKPARETVTWRLATQNGANGGNSGSVYTAKSKFVTFHPGQQYQTFDVDILKAMTTGQRINIVSGAVGSNRSGTVAKSPGYIMTQAEADSLTSAGTPPVLPTGLSVSPAASLPTVPKSHAGWSTVFVSDLVNDFEANSEGRKAVDNTTPCWFSRPGYNVDPFKNREQVGNAEDGFYTDPDVVPGTNPFPLVNVGGTNYRALRAENLDGTGGKPSSVTGASGKVYTYTASMITTRTLFPTIQTGDYVEVRAKMNPVLHTWPAIWLLPANPFKWPPEIDLLEGFFKSALTTDKLLSTIHYKDDNTSYGSFFGLSDVIGATFDMSGFHDWGCWLGPTWLVFYVDDFPYMMVPNMPLANYGPMNWYLLLNIAVGGSGSGVPDNPSSFPVDFVIDYAKVWRKTA